MGQPKEGVRMPDGRTMIEHVIEPLSHLCQNIVIVGDCSGFSIPFQNNLIPLKDDAPGRGPLFAIATLLKSGVDQDGYIVTACDQPFLTPALLRCLIGDLPRGPRFFQHDQDEMFTPFPGYYPVCWLSIIKHELLSGEYGLCNMIMKNPFETVSLPKEGQDLMRNINTPTDLETFTNSAGLP